MQYKSETEIIKDIKAGTTHPVYFLMGDEAFYLDKVADYIQANMLNETEREFDQQVLYGNDVILVVVYRKSLDKRSKLYKSLKKSGVTFESAKLKDYQVKDWISTYVRSQGKTIDPRSAELMAEFLGNDLSKIANEVGKLLITLPKDSKAITGAHIERNIGISKDFNNFELQDALLTRNVLKANRIIDYFAKNPNKNPMVLTLASLFGFFSNMMVIHYLPNKAESNVASALHVHPFVAKKLVGATRTYSAGKVFQIVALLREYDARSKGVENSSVTHGELLKELVFKIIH
jgi:DNA polymerase-3 subunit delta